MAKSVTLSEKDTVTTVTGAVSENEIVKVAWGNEIVEITAIENIPIFHKIAIMDMKKGEDILKYGEVIGVATKDISAGALVHSHNLSSKCQAEGIA